MMDKATKLELIFFNCKNVFIILNCQLIGIIFYLKNIGIRNKNIYTLLLVYIINNINYFIVLNLVHFCYSFIFYRNTRATKKKKNFSF